MTEREIRQQPQMHRQGEKSPLAYEIRRDRGRGAAISVQERACAPVSAQRESQPLGLFAPLATRHRRLRRRSTLRASSKQAAGALRLRDWGEHDPADHVGPCPVDVEAGRADLEFPEGPGLSKPIVVETDGGMVPIVEPGRDEKTNARARTCRGERRSFRWRTPRGAGRRSTPARSRAARRRPGGNCWPARFAPASGRTRGSTRLAMARHGLWAKSRSNLAIKADA